MKVKTYAKINLSLDLTGRLPDGYHSIDTVMQSVSLCDEVAVTLRNDGVISLGCSESGVPLDAHNTAYKAAEYFFDAIGSEYGADIFIKKNIPSQAGLAGGSGDAAGVLYCLNRLIGEKLSVDKILDIALRVGADVPFCFSGGTRRCLHKGEEMSALPDFDSFVLLAKPEVGVSTAAAFRRFDEARELLHPDSEGVAECYRKGNFVKAAELSLNIFEQLTDVEQREEIKKALTDTGAYYASMSGSGSCFFGLYEKEEDVNNALSVLREITPFVCGCRTVNRGIEEITE